MVAQAEIRRMQTIDLLRVFMQINSSFSVCRDIPTFPPRISRARLLENTKIRFQNHRQGNVRQHVAVCSCGWSVACTNIISGKVS